MIKMTAKTILHHSYRIAWKDLTELFRNRLGLVLLNCHAIVHDGYGWVYLSIQRDSQQPASWFGQ